jgi:hypothetical protein
VRSAQQSLPQSKFNSFVDAEEGQLYFSANSTCSSEEAIGWTHSVDSLLAAPALEPLKLTELDL